jgi:RNA recognition motif-containing protein
VVLLIDVTSGCDVLGHARKENVGCPHPNQKVDMNIYVGNLPFSTTSESLNTLFSRFGTVGSANVATDRETGRSRGFGFVEMDNAEEAKRAIEELDGTDIDGRRVTVNEARPKTDRPRGGGDRRGGSGGGGGYGNRSSSGGGGGGYGNRSSSGNRGGGRRP